MFISVVSVPKVKITGAKRKQEMIHLDKVAKEPRVSSQEEIVSHEGQSNFLGLPYY